MERRRYVCALGAGIAGLLSGCADRNTTASPTGTETSRENPDTIFVSATSGSSTGSGASDDPLNSVQRGIKKAEPGQTVFVQPGTYREHIETVRAGTETNPITITGPEDAVLRGTRFGPMLRINHSHIHLTGLTLNGLNTPISSNQVTAYSVSVIHCRPLPSSEAYLRNIKIKPHAIGNTQRSLIVINRTQDSEIGEFKMIGMAGAQYVLGDKEDHAGEIVYIGTPPVSYGSDLHPWTEIDQTRNIHVHHIDNSEGHPHSEIVNTKMGTRNILVEYCTDAGGSQNNEPRPSASVRFQSYDATLRWCDLRNGAGYGVHLQAGAQGYLRKKEDPAVSADLIGPGHSIYGNRIVGFDDGALSYNMTAPDEQRVVCGNEISGGSDTDLTESCPADIPTSSEIGHRGGDSPWDDS